MNMQERTAADKRSIASYLFARAFAKSRDLRSQAYKDGVMAAVLMQVSGTEVRCQFARGSAEWDAFAAGKDEGHAIGREYKSGGIAVPQGDQLPREIEQLRQQIERQEFFKRAG